MRQFKYIWIIGLFVTLLIIVVPIVAFISPEEAQADDPWAAVPVREPHVDHSDLLPGPYETGSDVTRACLECHEDAAHQVAQTVHWTWESEPEAQELEYTPKIKMDLKRAPTSGGCG